MALIDFYLRHDVHRATPGKKDTIMKYSGGGQKRYLLDTLKNLHKKILEESGRYSYASFAANRPFFIVALSVGTQNTCLCKLHSNVKFKILALRKLKIISTNIVNSLIEMTVCNIDSKDCRYKECVSCNKGCVPLDLVNSNFSTHGVSGFIKMSPMKKTGRKFL